MSFIERTGIAARTFAAAGVFRDPSQSVRAFTSREA